MNNDNDTILDLAISYASGTLSLDEMADFEDKLVAGDQRYIKAFEEVEQSAAQMLRSIPAEAVGLDVERKLFESIEQEAAAPITIDRDAVAQPRRSLLPLGLVAGFGWIAAALLLVMLVRTNGLSSVQRASGSIEEQRQELIEHAQDLTTLAWADWDNPEVSGVHGDVVWSDQKQEGYMQFENLPINDDQDIQYQLWIIDKDRGMGQRINGGVFSVDTNGTVVLPIRKPDIPVNHAIAFALTIEQPGGVWVSDMSRRVVIASE